MFQIQTHKEISKSVSRWLSLLGKIIIIISILWGTNVLRRVNFILRMAFPIPKFAWRSTMLLSKSFLKKTK